MRIKNHPNFQTHGLLIGTYILAIVISTFCNAYASTTVSGNVTYSGSPVCAMVLANGKYVFSDSNNGSFSLSNVPFDSKGQITLFAFCSGVKPYKKILYSGTSGCQISLPVSTGNSPPIVTINSWGDNPFNRGWVDISGTVKNSTGSPVNAMVLANGKYMFTSNPLGEFDLTVPLDANDSVTVFGFCDGLMPFQESYTGIPENPSPPKPYNQLMTEKLWGVWYFVYTIVSTWDDTYYLNDFIQQSSVDSSRYYVYGSDQYGDPVLAGYSDDLEMFTLLDTGPTFDQFYVFELTSTDTVSGCYFMIIDDQWSDCYPMDGTRISNSFNGFDKREPIKRDQAAELLQVNEINKTSTNVFHNDDIIETYSQIKSEIESIKMRNDF